MTAVWAARKPLSMERRSVTALHSRPAPGGRRSRTRPAGWGSARFLVVDPAQALADLTEISSQIQAAVLADESGAVIASPFAAAGRAERAARVAAELLRAAEGAGRPGLVQLEAATQLGSVFVVRDGGRPVAAPTGAGPTAGPI